MPSVRTDDHPHSILRRDRRGPVLLLGMFPLSREAAERMRRDLERAGWNIRVGEYLSLRAACAGGAAFISAVLLSVVGLEAAGLQIIGVAASAFGGWLFPRQYLSRKRQQRLKKIEEQLPNTLTSIAKSLRTGTGFLQALAYTADETPPPLGPELQSTLGDLQWGAEAEDAFTARPIG